MRFYALDLALLIIFRLRDVLPAIARCDARLHKQLREAGSSIALNLGEGSRRRGRDRRFLYTVASGSAEEVRTGLRTALAWGYPGEGRQRGAR